MFSERLFIYKEIVEEIHRKRWQRIYKEMTEEKWMHGRSEM
jgi:hypothetical protein